MFVPMRVPIDVTDLLVKISLHAAAHRRIELSKVANLHDGLSFRAKSRNPAVQPKIVPTGSFDFAQDDDRRATLARFNFAILPGSNTSPPAVPRRNPFPQQ